MAGPWEAYQAQPETPAAPAAGPWLAYQEPAAKSAAAPSLMQRIAALPRARVPEWVPVIGGWEPSAVGMIKGAAQQAVSAATLPGQVYRGEVKPTSEEGIRRSFELASSIGLPAPKQISLARRIAPLPTGEIKAASTAGYRAATHEARGVPLSPEAAADITANVRQALADAAGPRPARAGVAHAEIDKIANAKDLGDIVDIRQNLRDMLPKGGPDQAAAAIALKEIDTGLTQGAPQIMSQIRNADANWSAAMGAGNVEEALGRAQTLSGARQFGTRIQQQFRPLYKQEEAAGFLKPIEMQAMRRVSEPGFVVGTLRSAAALDPTTSGLGVLTGALGGPLAPLHAASAAAGGLAARLRYDQVMRNRAREVAELIRSRAPASMAVTGNQPLLRTGPNPLAASPFAAQMLQPLPAANPNFL